MCGLLRVAIICPLVVEYVHDNINQLADSFQLSIILDGVLLAPAAEPLVLTFTETVEVNSDNRTEPNVHEQLLTMSFIFIYRLS